MEAVRDQNFVPSALGVSSSDGVTPIAIRVDPITGRTLVDSASGSGTVTSVSVVSANGFAGSVATATTTPAITLTTTITGLLQGNGTAISAVTIGSGLSFAGGTLSATGSGLTVGTSTITSGTTTRILYDNAGVLGEYTITGTGTVVAMATSPSFTTPILGTPTSGTLTNCTGYTIANLAGAGTGVLTALAVNVGSAGAFVTFNGALGTPSSGTLTNATGLPIAGLVASTSTAIGVGSIELGNASDTTLSRSSAGVLAVEGVVIPSISSTNTFTNKRVTRRLTTTNAPGGTPSTNTDNVDVMAFTGLAAAITSMTTNLSGTPTDGDQIEFRFTDNGTARAITWGASFVATTVGLPTTTVISTMLRVYFEYTGSTWSCIGVV